MLFNFIFSGLNIIMLVVWVVLFIIVVLRFLRPEWACPIKFFSEKIWRMKNILFPMLIAIAIGLHFFYGAFVTWGQYHVWATGGEYTKIFISAPLSKEVPLGIFEGLRPAFEQPFGYFSYYVFGRIWLDIIILFALAGFFYSILKIWSLYRGGFLPHGPEILLVLMLISGYPGILILVPLGFAIAFASFGISHFRRTSHIRQIYLEPAFIIATPIALLFGKIIFAYF